MSTLLHRLGDGKRRVAGEDTPRLLRERSPIPEPQIKRRRRLGDGKSRVAGEDTPRLLRER